MLEADDEAGADGFGLPRQLDVLEAAHQLPEEGALGAAGEVGAQAEVLADPEAQVGVGIAVDPECEGIVEDLLVAVRRAVEGISIIGVWRLRADPNLSAPSRRDELSQPHEAVQGRLRRPLHGFALDSLARPR